MKQKMYTNGVKTTIKNLIFVVFDTNLKFLYHHMNYQEIIPAKLYSKVSDFFESKDKNDFSIKSNSGNNLCVEYIGRKADDNTSMKWFIYEDHCDFEFQNELNIIITLSYEDEDFDSWMDSNPEYGTELAHQFQMKYNESFENRINESSDTRFDEDFQINFIGNFINYALNNTLYED